MGSMEYDHTRLSFSQYMNQYIAVAATPNPLTRTSPDVKVSPERRKCGILDFFHVNSFFVFQ